MNYSKIYDDLMYKRQVMLKFNRSNKISKTDLEYNLPPAYGEYHHIKPRSLYPEYINDRLNIVCLTAREHFVAHKLLVRICLEKYGDHSILYFKMLNAYCLMVAINNKDIRISSNMYSRLRTLLSHEFGIMYKGINNPFF